MNPFHHLFYLNKQFRKNLLFCIALMFLTSSHSFAQRTLVDTIIANESIKNANQSFHHWPFYTYYTSDKWGESFHFINPLNARDHKKKAQNIAPYPFSLYTLQKLKSGQAEQAMLMNLIRSSDANDQQSLRLGPLLKLKSYDDGKSASIKILGGLIAIHHTSPSHSENRPLINATFGN